MFSLYFVNSQVHRVPTVVVSVHRITYRYRITDVGMCIQQSTYMQVSSTIIQSDAFKSSVIFRKMCDFITFSV